MLGNSLRLYYAGSSGSDDSRPSISLKIIKSNVLEAELDNEFAFKSWTYIIILAKLNLEKIKKDIYIDINYKVSFIN